MCVFIEKSNTREWMNVHWLVPSGGVDVVRSVGGVAGAHFGVAREEG